MKLLNQRGGINVLLIPLVLAVVCFFGALGFGVWAFMERAKYKEPDDQRVQAAVTVAVDKAKTEKDNEFVQREKEPYRDYQGPATLGSVLFKYPKTWSGWFKSSNTELQVLMQPGLVPGNEKSIYALRVEVVNSPYDRSVIAQESNVKSGKVKASAFSLEKQPDIVGMRFDGQIANDKKGSIVLLPMRDKTLKVTSEAEVYLGDFNSVILKTLTFSP
jgi:hypothetical protein